MNQDHGVTADTVGGRLNQPQYRLSADHRLLQSDVLLLRRGDHSAGRP